MKIKIIPTEKYDSSYKRKTEALVVPVLAIMAFALFAEVANKNDAPMSSNTILYINLIYGIGTAIWVYDVMRQQNREKFWSAFAAVFVPTLVIIIAALLKKRNLRFEIDTTYDEEVQAQELKKYADSFVKHSQFTEAGFIYKYLIAYLPHTDEDLQKYNEFKEQSKIPIPDFIIENEKTDLQTEKIIK